MSSERLESNHEALAGPIGTSLLLHTTALLAIFLMRSDAPAVSAPVYRVDLVAAPAGPRAAGEVGAVAPSRERPAPVPARPKPPATEPLPRQATVPTLRKTAPRSTSVPATETPPPKGLPAQAAGGGPIGGRGTDVATVRTEGMEFPYPGYLENIVRQIAIRFDPPRNAAVRAEIKFLIRRDGSVTIVQFMTRSGVFDFDLEAQAAVEAAGNARAFGPLPAGFPDDVLSVVFSFDPKVIR